MPTNFLQTLFEFLSQLWPFRMVEQWEEGVYYMFGRARTKRLTRGVYPVIPWFFEVRTASTVPAPVSTPLLNITLSDGRTLGYSATAIVRVADVWKALNEVDDYGESTSELVASRLSEKFMSVDAARLDYENRKRLLADLKRWVGEDLERFGVELMDLRLTNFAINQRAYRFLTDSAVASTAWGQPSE